MLRYRTLISHSIILLTVLTIANSDSSPLSDLTQEVLELLEWIPYDIKMFLNLFIPDFGMYISKTYECIQGELKGLSCNFNFSFDPFFVLEQCTKETGFDLIIKGIVELMPAIFLPVPVPPTVSSNRCFQLSSIPYLPEVVNVLTHPIEDIEDIIKGGVSLVEKSIEGVENIIKKPIKKIENVFG